MKYSISTLPFYPQPIGDILDRISELGIECCEIINEYPHDKFDYDVLNSYDIEFTIHSPISDVNVASPNENIRNSSIKEMKLAMDTAVKLNSDVVVIHPGHISIMGQKLPERIMEYNQESLLECSKYAQEVGVCMCVENMPDIEGMLFKDLSELEELVLDVDAYITLDAGHAHNNGFNVEDMLGHSRIRHIHLSDNDGTYDSHHAIGDNGNSNGLDFRSLLKRLERDKFDGYMVIEVEDPRAVDESISYLKKL